MSTFYRRLLIFLLLIPFTRITTSGQDVTGIWRGYFITDDGEQYKLEFQVKQNGSAVVSGVSYSYLDVRFYGKATMTGRFTKSSSSFRIQEIKTVEIKSLTGSGACIMNYVFTYARSGKEEFLDGTFLGKQENKYDPSTKYMWGDCGGGKVHLRKVTTSDFYVEPFLRKKINTPDLTQKDSAVKKIIPPPVKPIINKPVVKTNTTTDKNNTNVSKTTTPAKTKIDSIQKIQTPVVTTVPPKENISTPSLLKTRQNELVKTLVVTNPNVTVKLYDNGEIDDDTISVFWDKKLVLSSKRLTASPLTVKLKMEDDSADHELIMVAENLGRIPPNTSLMIVESGEQRFDVRITSTEQKNAVVRFKYQKLQ